MSKIDFSRIDFIHGLLRMRPFFVRNADDTLFLLNSKTMISMLRPHNIEFANRVIYSTRHAMLTFTHNIEESNFIIMINFPKC